jgi:hypothetical protein
MSEQEKIDWLKAIRDEIAILKDYLEVKYATNESLQKAKDNRDAFCLVREANLNKKFNPIYLGIGVIILFLVMNNGENFLNLILRVV